MFYILPTPIGNLKDISLRVLDILSDIEIILCEDTRVTKKLLSLLSSTQNITFPQIQFISVHSHNEKIFLSKIDKLFFDKNIAYMSDAGMPCVSDPGAFLIDYALTNNIPYEVVPGANALILAYVASGFASTEFRFFGFLPHKGQDRTQALNKVANSGCVSIVYEAPHRLMKFFNELVAIDPSIEVFVIKEATKLHEYKLKGTSLEVYEALKSQMIKGEWCIVINSTEKITSNISINDILKLDLQPKVKAKLLTKISNKSVKEWYNQLIGLD